MAKHYDDHVTQNVRSQSRADVDQGLRSFLLGTYNYMALALVITGLVAFAVASSPTLLMTIFTTPLKWVVMLAPLGFVFFLSARINHLQVKTAQVIFWVYAAMMGMSLASIFVAYTGASIARVFFITSATFGAMSLYGYTTKKDLASWGSFLIMGLIGLVIASVVNIFMQSSALHFALSVIGVLIFTGLTAYDTQQIKHMYYRLPNREVAAKASIMGALRLYLDFINLFLMLLRLFGDRR